MDYYKIGEVSHDFANAKRFKTASNKGIYWQRAIYAQDADGTTYKFANAIEAADKVIKAGYSTADQRAVRLNIIKAARKNGGRKNGIVYGFMWHFIEDNKQSNE